MYTDVNVNWNMVIHGCIKWISFAKFKQKILNVSPGIQLTQICWLIRAWSIPRSDYLGRRKCASMCTSTIQLPVNSNQRYVYAKIFHVYYGVQQIHVWFMYLLKCACVSTTSNGHFGLNIKYGSVYAVNHHGYLWDIASLIQQIQISSTLPITVLRFVDSIGGLELKQRWLMMEFVLEYLMYNATHVIQIYWHCEVQPRSMSTTQSLQVYCALLLAKQTQWNGRPTEHGSLYIPFLLILILILQLCICGSGNKNIKIVYLNKSFIMKRTLYSSWDFSIHSWIWSWSNLSFSSCRLSFPTIFTSSL